MELLYEIFLFVCRYYKLYWSASGLVRVMSLISPANVLRLMQIRIFRATKLRSSVTDLNCDQYSRHEDATFR